MSDLVLYEEDIAALNALLLRYIEEAQVLCALLTNKEGQLLTSQGKTEHIDVTSVAALVTGSFAATVSIANLIGEREFKTMFHRGNQRHIHICLIDEDRYLSSVFDNATDVDTVGHHAAAYGNQLRLYLESVSMNAESAYLPEIDLEQFIAPQGATADPQPANADLSALLGITPAPVVVENHLEILYPETPTEGDRQEALYQPPQPLHPDIPQPSNTAYLRIKIREARTFRVKKSSEDLISRFFGKKTKP